MLPLHIFCFFALFVPYLMPLSGGTTSLVERGRWCRSDMEMIRQRGRGAEIICHIAQICQKPNSTLCLPNESTTSALTKFLRSPPFLFCCVMHKILESREVEIFKKVHKVQDQKKYFATRANIAEH